MLWARAGRDAGFGIAAGFGAGVDFKLLLPRALCGRPPAEPENAFGFVDGAAELMVRKDDRADLCPWDALTEKPEPDSVVGVGAGSVDGLPGVGLGCGVPGAGFVPGVPGLDGRGRAIGLPGLGRGGGGVPGPGFPGAGGRPPGGGLVPGGRVPGGLPPTGGLPPGGRTFGGPPG